PGIIGVSKGLALERTIRLAHPGRLKRIAPGVQIFALTSDGICHLAGSPSQRAGNERVQTCLARSPRPMGLGEEGLVVPRGSNIARWQVRRWSSPDASTAEDRATPPGGIQDERVRRIRSAFADPEPRLAL